MTNPEARSPAPDGGCYAWSIVFASFMVSFLQDGFAFSYGVLIPSISEHFNTGRAEASLCSSILTLMTNGSGIFVAILVKAWGHRIVTNVGVLFSVIGMMVAGLCIQLMDTHDIVTIYLSLGFLTGLGFGLMYLPAMDIIELYFDKNLGLAFGIAAAGSGVGQLALAPIIPLLERFLGLANTFYLLGGCMSTGFIFGTIYRPPKVEAPNVTDERRDAESNEAKRNADLPSKSSTLLKTIVQPYKQVFTSPSMLLYLLFTFLINSSIFVGVAFTVDRALVMVDGLEKQTASYLLSIMGVANCVGRVIFGRLLDVGRRHVLPITALICLVLSASMIVSNILAEDTWLSHAIYAGVFGLTFGGYISSVMMAIKVIVSPENITTGLGVLMFDAAFSSLVGLQIVGAIYDAANKEVNGVDPVVRLEARKTAYATGFYIIGGFGIVGSLVLLSIKLFLREPNLDSSNEKTIE